MQKNDFEQLKSSSGEKLFVTCVGNMVGIWDLIHRRIHRRIHHRIHRRNHRRIHRRNHRRIYLRIHRRILCVSWQENL